MGYDLLTLVSRLKESVNGRSEDVGGRDLPSLFLSVKPLIVSLTESESPSSDPF